MEMAVEALKDRMHRLEDDMNEFVDANENLQEQLTTNKKIISLHEKEIIELKAAIQRLEA
jgi:predicted  nucleic acid-binding Zn-ribbon protein